MPDKKTVEPIEPSTTVSSLAALDERPSQKPTPEVRTIAINKSLANAILLVGVALIVGFGAGVAFESHHNRAVRTTLQGAQAGQYGGFGGFGGRRLNSAIGSVTAISTTSISVNDQRSGTTKTYSITSSTTITKAGAAATTADIAVGDTVMVRASSSTSTTATTIIVDPQLGAGQSTAPSTSSTDPNAVTQ